MKKEILDLVKKLNQQRQAVAEILQMNELALDLENHDKLQGYMSGLRKIVKHIESNQDAGKKQLVAGLKQMIAREEKAAKEDCGSWKNYSQGTLNAYKWFVNEIC